MQIIGERGECVWPDIAIGMRRSNRPLAENDKQAGRTAMTKRALLRRLDRLEQCHRAPSAAFSFTIHFVDRERRVKGILRMDCDGQTWIEGRACDERQTIEGPDDGSRLQEEHR